MDRITRLRIENARAIKSVDLRLGPGLTVLIGENGAGKSTILECLELLRKLSSESFMEQFYRQHGGLTSMLRKGSDALRLSVQIEDSSGQEPGFVYEIELTKQGYGAVIEHEELKIWEQQISFNEPLTVLSRRLSSVQKYVPQHKKIYTTETDIDDQIPVIIIHGKTPKDPFFKRLLRVLRGIEVQLRFETLARWAAIAAAQPSPLRESTLLQPATRLELLGRNLANAWSVLKNERSEEELREAMHLVRMGLGQDVDSINLIADAGGGQVGIALRRKNVPDALPASMLSDGQLAWLAFVAMVRLNKGRSVLAVDEPELHMHPYLVNAVVALLQTVEAPVVVATHSDHILSLLDDPVASVRVCALEQGEAVVRELDREEFERWRERYTDLGALRAAGHLERVLKKDEAG